MVAWKSLEFLMSVDPMNFIWSSCDGEKQDVRSLSMCICTVAAKIIRTISFLIKDSQNTDFLRFDGYQKNRHVV